ncbi:CDP-alcohol phosphatidyltransferase family protein [Candidatus Sumerlaeota bacterium]|nr:CDP-alcohol phosphatidyltransferase family protein [Candidatus Sumerlaeota bacterium]
MQKINWATRLTLLRISLTPLLAVFLYYHYYFWALLVFVIAALTDAIDGFIARVFDQKTWLGSFLDPAADKLLLLTAFVLLTFSKSVPLPIPDWVTIIIVFRDIIIVIGAGITLFVIVDWVIKPTILGKINTVFQFGTILFATIANLLISKGIQGINYQRILYLLAYTTLVLTMLSGLLYLRSGALRLLGVKKTE